MSTDEQSREGVSLAAQQERIAAYCQAQDWTLVETYVDPGFSGKNLERPALQRALADAAAKRFDVLLVWRLDRLSRRQRDVLHVVEDLLAPHGVGLRSITESFDTTSPAGKAMLGMLSVFGQLERETLQERTRAGKAQAAKEGRRLGPPPYGYARDGGKLVPVEPQASFIRTLYRRYLAGDGIEKLAAWANDESGARPKGGGRWHYNHLRIILTNPTYAGLQPHRGTAYPAPHEALVSEENWRAVQAELAQRSLTHTARVRAADYLLSGLRPRCGICGAPVHGTRSPANWPRKPTRYNVYYVCSRNHPPSGRRRVEGHCALPWLRRDDVEAAVVDALRQLAWDEDLLRERLGQTAARRQQQMRERDQQAQALRRDLADVDRRIARWYDAFESGGIDPTDLAARTGELRERKAALDAALTGLARAPADPGDGEVERVIRTLRDIAAVERMDNATLREFLREGAEGIVLYPDRVEVRLLGIG